jgi:hypothetical protein
MRTSTVVAGVVCLVIAMAGPVEAGQTTAGVRAAVEQRERELRTSSVRPSAMDARIGSLIAAPANQVGVEIGKDGAAVGKARFVFAPAGSDSSFDVVLKGPISSSGDGQPFTDTGLGNGATARFGYNLSIFTTRLPAAARPYADSLEEYVVLLTQPAAGAQTALGLPAGGVALESEMLRSRLADVVADHSFFLSASVEVGRQSFSYLNADLTKAAPVSHTDHLLNAGLGYSRISRSNGNPLFFAAVGYSEGERHTAQRSRQICSPVSGTSSLECASAVIGAPALNSARTVEFDLRSWSHGQKVGFNPRFIHERLRESGSDVLKVTRTAEIAISYLVYKKKEENGQTVETGILDVGAFTGGVRVGVQRGDRSGMFFAVFFGTVLGAS